MDAQQVAKTMTGTPRHIAVVALRRSGTTALWRLLRQDTRYTCYDEPFSHLLDDLPADNEKQTRAEYIELYEHDPERFRSLYAPIRRGEEVSRQLTAAQERYLKFLLEGGPVAFDTTRCMGKIPALHSVIPGAVMVHLFRHPIAFASSHLQPSDSFDPLGIRKSWNRRTALTRRGRFNGWGMEELARGPHFAATSALLANVGVRLPTPGERVPAFYRLLAIWLAAYRLAERDGRQSYGERFLSLSFEDFCREPDLWTARIQDLAQVDRTSLDASWLKRASKGLQPGAPQWAEGARWVGFNEEELDRFFSDEASE